VLVGGPAAGKTALVQRHQTGVFMKHKPSASPDFSLVHWDETTQVHLWDVPSGESATGHTPIWYEGARGFLVVADVSQSVNAAADWLTDVRKRMPGVPVVLLLNKRDLAGGTASARAAVDHFARSEGVSAYFETSALEGVGFAEALKHLVALAKK
jgi:small GTP-binding protein